MDPALCELLRTASDGGAEEVEAIIRLDRPHVEVEGLRIVSCFGPIATCRLRTDDILRIRAEDHVGSLKLARSLKADDEPECNDAVLDLPLVTLDADERRPPGLPLTGAGVLIGIVDWGCDFDYESFKHTDGSTRLVALWDQRGPSPRHAASHYGYGTVHSRRQIDRALRHADPYAALGYHPADADKRSLGAHGTHCMDIAAGNGLAGGPLGVAPCSDLMFVHVANRATAGLANLGDSVRILEAVDCIARTAAHRRQPWVVNLSLGNHGGPHDGRTPAELAFDFMLRAAPGRCIVNSAGNYRSKRIHASGRLGAEQTRTLSIMVDEADTTPNELELWYARGDEFAVRTQSPTGVRSAWVARGEHADVVDDGQVVGQIYNRTSDPYNSDHVIDIFLYPGAPSGFWSVTLQAGKVADGGFHAWLERDDTCSKCQTRFAAADSDSSCTTGTLANSREPLIVGAYDRHSPLRQAASFSSCGPTRDGRPKPDLFAPGVGVLAARSAPYGGRTNQSMHARQSGTSMAAPHVTGAAALCLQGAKRPLWNHEIRDLLLSNTEPLTASAGRSSRLGFGCLNVARVVDAVIALPSPAQVSPHRRFDTQEHRPQTEEGKMKAHMVEHLDRLLVLVQEPASRATSERRLLSEITRMNGVSGDLIDPDDFYREIVFGRGGPLAEMIEERFTVLARPHEAPTAPPRACDVLLRVAHGHPGLGHVAVLLDGRLWSAEQLARAPFRSERSLPGYYAAVLEGGAFPHARYGRLVLDPEGRVPAGAVLIRVKEPSDSADSFYESPAFLEQDDDTDSALQPSTGAEWGMPETGWPSEDDSAGEGENAADLLDADETGSADDDRQGFFHKDRGNEEGAWARSGAARDSSPNGEALARGSEGAVEGHSEREWEDEREEAASQGSAVRARILWPALGFPAVIAPRDRPAGSAMLDADATRCVCVLLLSNRKYLSKAEAAKYLRYAPWAGRGRRYIRPTEPGSFAEEELSVRNDENEPRLVLPSAKKDRWGALVAFGADREGEKGITVNLAHYVRDFYRKQHLSYLHEIRISEAASGRLQDGPYHLFWNNENPEEKAPSDEMALLLRQFAPSRRDKLGDLWTQLSTYLLDEFEYEYGGLHPPYQNRLAMRRTRAEVLHPLFVRRNRKGPLRIGHITDTHVDVRADVYEENLKQAYAENLKRKRVAPSDHAWSDKWTPTSYNNWNKSFVKNYDEAKQGADVLLLTGDLIDYGRGHWGLTARDRLGDDSAYHKDRNWFLFYHLLAAGDAYRVPVYTILGNHDWRLNPYPPFAIAGAPSPQLLINNYEDFSKKQQDEILRVAHGPGHQRAFSYSMKAESPFQLLLQNTGDAGGALLSMAGGTRTMNRPHMPTETTIDSVAWYLLAINPFLDYTFSLPSGHSTLMLDWAEDEDVLFPIVERGKEHPYQMWEAKAAADPGPKARNCLTSQQKRLVNLFAEQPGKAKIVGIHAPPIGPYTDWSDDDLLQGRKIYDGTGVPRGPTNYAVRKPDGSQEKWNGHPLFAIRPPDGALGMEADYNSLSNARDWFIRRLAEPTSGVRVVLTGHIHRSGLYVVHVPGADRGKAVAGQMLVRGLVEAAVRGARPPAVALTPEGKRAPLYVNTTSAGPRGNYHPRKNESAKVDPGYAHVELASDGTINRVDFRPQPRLKKVRRPARTAAAPREAVVPGRSAAAALEDAGFAHRTADYFGAATGIGLGKALEEDGAPHEAADSLLLLDQEAGSSERQIAGKLAAPFEFAPGSDGFEPFEVTDDLGNEERYAFDEPGPDALDPEWRGEPADGASEAEAFELEEDERKIETIPADRFRLEDQAAPELEEQVPFTLPQAASALPSDATLRRQLQTIGTAEARALDRAFAMVGKPNEFAAALATAVRSLPEPSDRGFASLRTHLTRLGAEAFVLEVSIPVSWQTHIGFVDHPGRLREMLTLADQENFLHFAVRRLHQISSSTATSEVHRRQMDRAAVLLRVLQLELRREYRPAISSEALLVDHRTLLVQIIWKHYQALLDRLLAAAGKSRLPSGVIQKEWEKDLRTAAITRIHDERALLPKFRLTSAVYRDYFEPTAATDIGYNHYSSARAPVTGGSFELPFRTVFHQRVEQKALVEDLQKESDPYPLPKLHDSASWQAWIRKTWDKPLLRREQKITLVLGYVNRYFNAFTVHAPHDLREGCVEKSYLTRGFPRAVTGSLVHDCAVYALRWLHMLGRLFTPGSTPPDIAKPRIYLIEMPAHVGAMIRAQTKFNRHVLIGINNKHAAAYEFDAEETDEVAAQRVVQDMYSGMMTPFIIRPLTSKPSDGTVLWNEVCKIYGKKLTLPYSDMTYPPHLRYLAYNAGIARISRELSRSLASLWVALHQKLDSLKDRSGKVHRTRLTAEIRQYAALVEKTVQAASSKYATEVKPLIAEINDDLGANQKRIPSGALIVETTPELPWQSAFLIYRAQLERAQKSGDLSHVSPERFFPEDDFAAAVE